MSVKDRFERHFAVAANIYTLCGHGAFERNRVPCPTYFLMLVYFQFPQETCCRT